MTVSSIASAQQRGGDSGAAEADVELAEELCQVQARILAMGEDNYARLRRVCPDPRRRYRVLQARVTRQVQLTLAATVPRWRASPQPRYDAAATATAAQELWIGLDAAGGAMTMLNVHAGDRRGDSFSPGPPHDAERCWRCDARNAANDIGLCPPCHRSLTGSRPQA